MANLSDHLRKLAPELTYMIISEVAQLSYRDRARVACVSKECCRIADSDESYRGQNTSAILVTYRQNQTLSTSIIGRFVRKRSSIPLPSRNQILQSAGNSELKGLEYITVTKNAAGDVHTFVATTGNFPMTYTQDFLLCRTERDMLTL